MVGLQSFLGLRLRAKFLQRLRTLHNSLLVAARLILVYTVVALLGVKLAVKVVPLPVSKLRLLKLL